MMLLTLSNFKTHGSKENNEDGARILWVRGVFVGFRACGLYQMKGDKTRINMVVVV